MQLKTMKFTILDQLTNIFFYKIRRPILINQRKKIKPNIISIRGVKIKIHNSFSNTIIRSIYGENYEKPELDILRSYLSQEDIVMELGTGLGLLSSYCAKKVGSDRVFSYEANPNLQPIIEENYALNNVNPRLKICLLDREKGYQTFYVGKDFWSSSNIKRNSTDKAIEVQVNEFNQEINKINPTFLIIDIEGGEYELLQYAQLNSVQKVLIEIHPHVIGEGKATETIDNITKLGFTIRKVKEKENIFLFQK